MTVVPTVPIVSLVSVAEAIREVFGDHSACRAFGVLGVCSCICEVLW